MAVRPSMTFRVSPSDKAKLQRRAQEEGRSMGEAVSLMLRENELAFASKRVQDKAEGKRQSS